MNRHSSLQDAPDGVSRQGALMEAVVKRTGRITLRMLAAVALVAGSAMISSLANPSPAFAALDWDCGSGVTVVVDFTDLGGTIEVGCAEGDPETGRDALVAADFTATDSQPGFLCAINSKPDPCPETFEGSFWSYWHGNAAGEWESYQVGADSSSPAPGDVEGWRYNDGTIPPAIAPASAGVSTILPSPEPTVTASPDNGTVGNGESATSTDDPFQQQQAEQNFALSATAIGFAILVGGLVLLFVLRARRRGPDAHA